MADLIYEAKLDDKQILAALKRIDAGINRLSKKASSDFQAVGKSASASGVQIGAIAGIAASITTAFINLGQQAITALIDIGKQSVQTALEVDTLKARLGGIFDGSQEAADQAFAFIQDRSKELGIDLSELAGAFIPKTESLAQFERVAKIATALARSDPEQGAIGARIALIEALSGTFTSIQRRFEIPKEDINRIKEAFDKEGIEGFLTTLETILKESGKSFEDFAGTATTSFARLEIAGQQLGGRLGAPIVESLQNAAEKINDFIGANEDDLIVFADTIGRTIGDVINLISSIDLAGLDTQGLIEFADYIQRIVASVQLLAVQFSGLDADFGGLNTTLTGGIDIFGALSNVLMNIDDAFVVLSQGIALARATYAGLTASLKPLIEALEQLTIAAAKSAAFDYAGAVESLGAAATAVQNNTESQAAFNASLQNSLTSFDTYKKSIDDNKDSQQTLRKELEEMANAGTGAADAIQAQMQAAKKATEANAAYEEALGEVNEKFSDAQQELGQKLEDIDIETARKRFDILEEFANKREDLARDNARRLEDIARETEQKIQDATTDLNRQEQDIALKFVREQADLEREQANKRIDIEVEYRRKLKDIRRQFELDAEEAERNRDAVGFLRALRQRNEEINQAQVDRQRTINDTKTEGQRKREELALQQQQELEDARLANERKLEDIRLFNQQALEENRIRLDREQEDLSIAEARKLEELELNRQRDIEDANKAYERKIADLEESLNAELELIKEYEQAKREEYALTAEAAAASAESPGATGGAAAGFGDNPSTISTGNSPAKSGGSAGGFGSNPGTIGGGHAFGGLVNTGQAYPIGERGPELFVPSSNGRIIPNSAVMMNTQGNGIAGGISNSKTQMINLPVTDTGLLQNPIFVAQIRNLILNELDKVS